MWARDTRLTCADEESLLYIFLAEVGVIGLEKSIACPGAAQGSAHLDGIEQLGADCSDTGEELGCASISEDRL